MLPVQTNANCPGYALNGYPAKPDSDFANSPFGGTQATFKLDTITHKSSRLLLAIATLALVGCDQ